MSYNEEAQYGGLIDKYFLFGIFKFIGLTFTFIYLGFGIGDNIIKNPIISILCLIAAISLFDTLKK